MKKIGNRGFLLVETLIVSTFIASTMVFIFVQYRRINQGYERSFSYNTIEGIYATKEINKYILNNGYYKIVEYMSGRTDGENIVKPELYATVYDGVTCSNVYLEEIDYCNRLMADLNVKQVLITNSDITDFQNEIDDHEELDAKLRKFIKYIKYDVGDTEIRRHRTIVVFNDDTYATLKLYQREG